MLNQLNFQADTLCSCDTSLTGVPQGSGLGHLHFDLFLSPGGDVIELIPDNKSGIVSIHQYADDTEYIGANSSTLIVSKVSKSII